MSWQIAFIYLAGLVACWCGVATAWMNFDDILSALMRDV